MNNNEHRQIEDALNKVREKQTAFWKALGELESLLRVELDSTQDFYDATVESLSSSGDEEDES